MLGFMFRLFASVSSRIPFDVHDESWRVFVKGWRTEQEHHTTLRWAKEEGLCSVFGTWLLCPVVPLKSDLCKMPLSHALFPYIHILSAIMTCSQILPLVDGDQWTRVNRMLRWKRLCLWESSHFDWACVHLKWDYWIVLRHLPIAAQWVIQPILQGKLILCKSEVRSTEIKKVRNQVF